MLRAVRPVGFAVLVALSLVAGASWAQQPGTTHQGPPTPPMCSTEQFAKCKQSAYLRCGSDKSCLANALTSCGERCGGVQ